MCLIIPGSKIKIVASFFSIYAYETLKKELESVEALEFIFPAPTFVSEGIKGTIKKEVKEFYIPKQLRESSLYGTEFEIRLRNQLTQRVIARECADCVNYCWYYGVCLYWIGRINLMDYVGILVGLGLVFAMVGLYIIVTLVNRKTKVPAGCELAYLEATCGACLNKSCEIKKEEKVSVI